MASQEMVNALTGEDSSVFDRALRYVKGLKGIGAPLADRANEAMMTALGPQGRKAVAPVAGLANVFSLGAEVGDMAQSSRNAVQNIQRGKIGPALLDVAYSGAGLAGLALPLPSPRVIKQTAEGVADSVMKFGDEVVDPLAGPQIFAGERAVGARLDKLEEAKKMASEGEADTTIFAATGWRLDDDAKNKFEISDADARTNPTKKAGTTPLPDVIDHPELFQNYPSLRNVDVKLRSRPGLGSYYHSGEDRIYTGSYSVPGGLTRTEMVKKTNVEIRAINQKIQNLIDRNEKGFTRGSADEAEYVKLVKGIQQIQSDAKRALKGGGKASPDKDVLLHEIQHAIQKRENFARGGSASDLRGVARPDNPKWQRWSENKDRVARAVKVRGSQEYKDQIRLSNEVFNRDYQPRLNAIELETDKIPEGTLRNKAYQEQTEALFAEARLAHDNQFPLVAEVEEVGRKFGLKEPPRKLSDLETYRNLKGEVEARNVEGRMNMTPAERAETFPGLTEDVPLDDQIITRYGQSPMDSASSGFDALPTDEASRMARAREMGFDTDAPLYRGTTEQGATTAQKSFEAGDGIFLSDNPDVAEIFRYPREYGEVITENYDDALGEFVGVEPGDLQTLYARMQNPMRLSGENANKFTEDTAYQIGVIKAARAAGNDSIVVENVMEGVGDWTEPGTTVVALRPVRAKAAQFDPAKAGSADILAGLAGLGVLGAGAAALPQDDSDMVSALRGM
jgi:hypothetical protein